MELVINETVPETAISIIDERKLSHANHILRTYGYVVIGILLTLVNFPVFIIVARHRKLRLIDLFVKDIVKMRSEYNTNLIIK